jgi:hypothetical protein
MKKWIKALCVAGLSLGMAAPAFAAAEFYGSLRYDTFFVNQKSDDAVNAAGDDSTTMTQNDLAANSRFGVKFTKGDKLFGHFEMGIKGYNGSNELYTRLMYGTYKFSGGSLLLGQTYTPWTMFTDQAFGYDNGNIGFGALYDSRQPQFKISLDNGLWIDFVTTHNGTKFDAGDVQYDQIPKMGIGYDGKAGSSTFGAGFAYQTYKEQNDANSFDENVDSYLVFARAKVAVGAVKVSSQIHYGQNLGNFGIAQRPNAFATLDANGVKNTNGWGGFLQVGTAMTQMVSANVGAGFTRDEQADVDHDQTTVFVNFPIKIADGFQVVPEFDYFHYNHAVSASTIEGINTGAANLQDEYVFGAKWQMDF